MAQDPPRSSGSCLYPGSWTHPNRRSRPACSLRCATRLPPLLTVKVGVVGAALHESAAAHAARRLRAVAQVRCQPAGGAVCAQQHAALHAAEESAFHREFASVKLGLGGSCAVLPMACIVDPGKHKSRPVSLSEDTAG